MRQLNWTILSATAAAVVGHHQDGGLWTPAKGPSAGAGSGRAGAHSVATSPGLFQAIRPYCPTKYGRPDRRCRDRGSAQSVADLPGCRVGNRVRLGAAGCGQRRPSDSRRLPVPAVRCWPVQPAAPHPDQHRHGPADHRGGQTLPDVSDGGIPDPVRIGRVGVCRPGNIGRCYPLVHCRGQFSQGFPGPRADDGAAQDFPPPVYDEPGEAARGVLGHGPVDMGVPDSPGTVLQTVVGGSSPAAATSGDVNVTRGTVPLTWRGARVPRSRPLRMRARRPGG